MMYGGRVCKFCCFRAIKCDNNSVEVGNKRNRKVIVVIIKTLSSRDTVTFLNMQFVLNSKLTRNCRCRLPVNVPFIITFHTSLISHYFLSTMNTLLMKRGDKKYLSHHRIKSNSNICIRLQF